MFKEYLTSRLAMRILTILLIGLFVFITYQVVYAYHVINADQYSINKTDASVQEWFDQNVRVWHPDPAGDVPNADEDIINTWVATGDNLTLNFLMQLNEDPALNNMLRHAVAYIDCDLDGKEEGGDPDDILITYETWEQNVFIMRGDQNQGQSFNTGHNRGQRVGDYVEWGLSFSVIPPNNPFINESDCLGEVNISFSTANTESYPGLEIDDTGPPTVIKLANLEANSPVNTSSNIPLLVGSIIAFAGIFGFAVFIRHKSRNS